MSPHHKDVTALASLSVKVWLADRITDDMGNWRVELWKPGNVIESQCHSWGLGELAQGPLDSGLWRGLC